MSKSEIEKARQELAQAIESAAEKLPHGWVIQIHIEQGYGGVVLVDPEGNDVEEDEYSDIDANLSDKVNNAIAHAITNDDEIDEEWIK